MAKTVFHPAIPIAFVVALATSCLVAAPASAQLAGPTLAHPSVSAPKKKEAAPAKTAKACPEYGAGYMRLEGTGTCVKVGGYVRFQGGSDPR